MVQLALHMDKTLTFDIETVKENVRISLQCFSKNVIKLFELIKDIPVVGINFTDKSYTKSTRDKDIIFEIYDLCYTTKQQISSILQLAEYGLSISPEDEFLKAVMKFPTYDAYLPFIALCNKLEQNKEAEEYYLERKSLVVENENIVPIDSLDSRTEIQ